MINVCIREYGVLFPELSNVKDSLCSRVIPQKDWNWLLKEASGTEEHKPLVRPIKRNGYTGLQVLNYVGVITTPFGCQIEIIPKIVQDRDEGEGEDEVENSRSKLAKMLSKIGLIKFRNFNNASLKVFNKPLPEVLINQFLNDVRLLIKRGIRNDYVAIREEAAYLKGRLQIATQIRQPVGRQHLFQVEHDEFLPDRAENRLIHSALIKVSKQSKNLQNTRLANELLFVFDDIPKSLNYKLDFTRWLDNDRSMVHYKAVKLWCDLILNGKTPFSLADSHHGLSFLFSMNVLFEKYVAVILRDQLKKSGGYNVKEQASSKYLVENHGAIAKFQLRPDILIRKEQGAISVLDTKWKLIDESKISDNYGISQADMYQLYAYGKKYLLEGKGEVFLIYPETAKFKRPLPKFCFDENLSLWAVPFKWASCMDETDDHVDFGVAKICAIENPTLLAK